MTSEIQYRLRAILQLEDQIEWDTKMWGPDPRPRVLKCQKKIEEHKTAIKKLLV